MPMDAGHLLHEGIEAAKQGRKAQARSLLNRVIALDQRNELAWLWLSAVVETDQERTTCLEHVVAINPGNEDAARGLEALSRRQWERPQGKTTSPVPWYFSTTTVVLTFFFCTPLWAILILADKRHGKGTKAFAAVYCTGFAILLGYLVLYVIGGAQFTTLLLGPAEVRFGSQIDDSTPTPSLKGEVSQFPDGILGNDIAWIASLRGPARTTKLDLVLSMGTGAGGEVVIGSNPLQLADPGFDTIYGTLSPGVYFTPGTYSLRVMSGDSILAEGRFDVP